MTAPNQRCKIELNPLPKPRRPHMTQSGLDAGGDQNFSVAKPFGGGPEIAEFVDRELVNTELKRVEGLLLALLYPFKWSSPRRDMRVKVLARLLLYKGVDISKEGWIEWCPGWIICR